jgi:hypothetical protein
MSLEAKSRELKNIMATYNSDWLLGDLYSLIHAGRERARDQLGKLSSPLRQLYYLAGLNITSNRVEVEDIMYNPEKWEQIVLLLNDIEAEYDKLFFPEKPEDVTEEWKRIRKVAMPSFLMYFNQGPLNYEEQVISWINGLYTPLDNIIEGAIGLKTEDFIAFYDKLDRLRSINFQAHSTRKELLRPNWQDYTKIQMGTREGVPDFIKEMGEQNRHIYTMMSDHGITDRFYPKELVSPSLPIEKVQNILNLLTVQRGQTEYLYYTATKPGNLSSKNRYSISVVACTMSSK